MTFACSQNHQLRARGSDVKTARFIPCLLLQEGRLVKTTNFRSPVYVGDPINVLNIFSDMAVNELFLLDISSSRRERPLRSDFLEQCASECFIPMAFGGGIQTASQAKEIIQAGVEKVVLNTLACTDIREVERITHSLGSQAVVASIDVREIDGEYKVFANGGRDRVALPLEKLVVQLESSGIGELLVTSIDHEGTRCGIDLDLTRLVTDLVRVPVIAHGGVGCREDLAAPVLQAGAAGTAAGTEFLFLGGRESVVINYPGSDEILDLLEIDARPSDFQDNPSVDSPSIRMPAPGQLKTCIRCVINDSVPGSDLNSSDICSYCSLHDKLEMEFPLGDQGQENLNALVDRIKSEGSSKQYDCIVGVSGGTDSSFLIHTVVELGLRPLAVHFDNTWNSTIATSNIHKVLTKLGVDLETYVVDNNEYDDIYRSFLRAGVRDVDAATDIAFMSVLYSKAEHHGIKHILEGHSFRTEGIGPLRWLYMDGAYVTDVHKKYGKVPLKTFPNLKFWPFLRWSALRGLERHRPLYHLDYNKEFAKKFLSDKYGWEWYGGHHLENRFTAFHHTVILAERFQIDTRIIEIAALVRSGQISRDEGFNRLAQPNLPDPEIVGLVKKRLDLTDSEYDSLLSQPLADYTQFHTYKRRFELFRPLFWILYKLNRVPRSFYIKFCTRRS